jgi:protein-disulfide isomerase
VAHPEIVYAVIKAHPAQFLEVVQGAVQAAQDSLRARAATADSARVEEGFRHPQRVDVTGRAGFGNPAAPVTIVEYTDFECPFCQHERDVLVEVLKHYGPQVRLVVKQLPLTEIHPQAMPAALLFEAVARQDPAKAYKLYDILYTQQERLKREGAAFLREAVAQTGADAPRALAVAASDSLRAAVDADLAEAKRLGFSGTPSFLINGVPLVGAHPVADFTAIIDRHLGLAHGATAPVSPAAPKSTP